MSRVHGEDYSTGSEHALKVNSSGQIEINLLSGEDQTNSVFVVEQGQFDYQYNEGTATSLVLGATGAAGDFLHKIHVQSSVSTVAVVDGNATFYVIPAGVTDKEYEFNVSSANGAWKIGHETVTATTLAIGRFT